MKFVCNLQLNAGVVYYVLVLQCISGQRAHVRVTSAERPDDTNRLVGLN